MILLNLDIFIGRWHPLIVHLPIGFLLLGILLLVMSRFNRFRPVMAAVPVCFLAGTIAAVLACVTGYLLSVSEEYAGDLLERHRLLGFITAAVACICWLATSQLPRLQRLGLDRFSLISSLFLFVAISITGHLGGLLTHGEDYLWSDQPAAAGTKAPITDYAKAYAFRDVIHPILDEKCGICHNDRKKKGRLSLDNYEKLLKGGKHGVVVITGDAKNSELIRRVMLKPSDRKFMPADNKPALTENERKLLIWWIDAGAPKQDQSLTALNLSDESRALFQEYFTNGPGEPKNENDPESTLGSQFTGHMPAPVSPRQLHSLKAQGLQVRLIHQNPDLLDVRLFASPKNADLALLLNQLLPFKKNILWLDLSATGITDKDLTTLIGFENLRKLNLRGNPVTDKGLAVLQQLNFLESINLAETSITNESLASLKLPHLKTVYVWKSGYRKSGAEPERTYSFNVINGFNDPLQLKN